MRNCLVFLSQSTGPVRLAVPVNSEKFDSRRPSGKKKLKNPPRPFGQKKNQNSETQKSPEKEFKTHHKHFKSEISRLGKIFPRPTFLKVPFYIVYAPLLQLSLSLADSLHSTCRFLTFPLSAWPVTNMALQFSLDFSQLIYIISVI